MTVRRTVLAALLTLALSGCTVYESYTVSETRSEPARPVEVAREGDVGSFGEILVSGADLAAAIIAPVAVVAKAAVISVVDVEVNRSKETRTISARRWLSTEGGGFPGMKAGVAGQFDVAEMEVSASAAGGECQPVLEERR